MTDGELEELLLDLESQRVERKPSPAQSDSIHRAICSFSNDLHDYRKPGVIFVGVKDDGSCAGLKVSDDLLLALAEMRSDGTILPLPQISVEKKTFGGCEMAVVFVQPADAPPVRYKGVVYVRVGPSNRFATPAEERRLSEKRRFKDLPFDLHPLGVAKIEDLDLEWFQRQYLPFALSADVLAENERTDEQQLASLRFVTHEYIPTVLGVLVLGKRPGVYLPGAYVQFVRFEGTEMTDPIKHQKEIGGPISQIMLELDEIFGAHISVATNIQSQPTEVRRPDYPIVTLQQIARNAIMHRAYEATNAPVRINWFSDRIEISNPGGPFGQVTPENFGQPGVTDYRNPHLAEALKNLGYVQRFGVGIQLARRALEKNGNPPLSFRVEPGYVQATIRRNR